MPRREIEERKQSYVDLREAGGWEWGVTGWKFFRGANGQGNGVNFISMLDWHGNSCYINNFNYVSSPNWFRL